MRKRFMSAMIAIAIVTVAVPLVLAQRGGGPRRVQGIPCINDWQLPDGCEERTGTHDPRDLSGVWTRYQGAGNMGNDVKLTPLGQKRWEANLPSFGPRAVVPAKGNDPMGLCDPLGILRNVFTEVGGRGFEFVHPMGSPERILQFFEWAHAYRTIYMDGRQHPKDPVPRWMGYSVGRWEGDTLVVETMGIDPRTWADMWGRPHSENLLYEERYHRRDFDDLELQVKMTDPEIYPEPFVSDTKVLMLNVESTMDEKLETFCVPSEEQRFNETIRDPAGGVLN